MVGGSDITSYLEAGVRAETLRQQAIASNIANSQTPGYRRIDVRFAELVAEAIERGDAEDIDAEILRPMATPVDGKGNDVSLDAEMGEMVRNTLLQKAYMRLLAGKYRKVEAAINTGPQ